MAAPKSSRSADGSPAGAAEQPTQVLSAFLETRLKPGQRLCVGLSGGRDSVVLLHALSQLALPVELSAVHVHHGLSANADAWAAFCAEFCRARGLPLDVVRVDVPRASGAGLEAAARQMRHAVFGRCAVDWLALGHHRDDQAETVLLNLLRGAGVAGAAGMLPERPQACGPTLIRPLLEVPRAALEAYAAQHSLLWIDDESNEDVHYRRNFLRRAVMPRLAEKFPGAQPALARAAGHFAEAASLLDDLARLDRAAVTPGGGRIALHSLKLLALPRARNLLRFELLAAGFRAPETRWIDEALRQLASLRTTAETCVSTPDGEIHAYRGELHLVRQRPPVLAAPLAWAGEAELPWADGRVLFLPIRGAGLSRRLLDAGDVHLQARAGGERLQPDARRPRRSLRNLLQESAVPPWERSRLPFLWCGERLAWVGGLGVDAAFACPPDEDGIQIVWSAGEILPDSSSTSSANCSAGMGRPNR